MWNFTVLFSFFMFQLMHGKFCLNGHVTTVVVSYVGDGNKHNLGI